MLIGLASVLEFVVTKMHEVGKRVLSEDSGEDQTDFYLTSSTGLFLSQRVNFTAISIGIANSTDIEKDFIFGFHRYPLRSVNHLHMHCLLRPLKYVQASH